MSRFLQDLSEKKRQVIMSNILSSREGPQILSSQKQILLKDLRRHRDQDEDLMSVDENEAPLSVRTQDLKRKDNYLFFELFSLYTKQISGK